MHSEPFHVSDESLLLYADGELAAREAAAVCTHLAACWECRTRLTAIEGTIGDFIHSYHEQSESRIPRGEGPVALFRAQVRRMDRDAGILLWRPGARLLLVGGMILGLLVVTVTLVRSSARARHSVSDYSLQRTAPERGLTPGETIVVTAQEVCSPGFPGEDQLPVPDGMKKQVFEEYGMTPTQRGTFAVDYLINPDLGGATSVRNLWPEPASQTIWNAKVKDQLERRLKALVCSGKMDLATAQHELASDWITSYKKNFHRNEPDTKDQ